MPAMRKPFDPQETVSLPRPGVPVWVFVVFALMSLAGAAGFVAWYEHGREVESPVAPPPVVLEAAPAPIVSPEPAFSPYAIELASAHAKSMYPSPELLQEFETLLRNAREEYGRSTDMQIRDAVWSVSGLYVYNRPDIDILKAARMIVDWVPEEVSASTSETLFTSGSDGVKTRREGEGARRVVVSNMPVSRAVDAITQEVVSAYNETVRAQWEAYYAQQAAANARRLARAEQEAAMRRAQEQAAAQAQAAYEQAVMEQQRWRQAHSVYGQLMRR
jgi:hypothetical protein